jgi:hypothetical protein
LSKKCAKVVLHLQLTDTTRFGLKRDEAR